MKSVKFLSFLVVVVALLTVVGCQTKEVEVTREVEKTVVLSITPKV